MRKALGLGFACCIVCHGSAEPARRCADPQLLGQQRQRPVGAVARKRKRDLHAGIPSSERAPGQHVARMRAGSPPLSCRPARQRR